MKNHVPSLAIVLGGPHPGDSAGSSNEGEASMEGIEAAMEDLMAALKDGDAKKAASAFHNAFLSCEGMPHSESGEEESAPE
jgi:hypothetical protein